MPHNSPSVSNPNWIILYVVLILSIGQSVDIYLPSMPAMAKYFNVSAGVIQMTLTIAMLSFGLSQLLYGPLSDVKGRRAIILIGILIFILGGIICYIAPSMTTFYIGRVIQGFGIGAAGAVCAAIPYDVFHGPKLVRVYSYIGMALAITPVLAPVLGGVIHTHFGWRATFLYWTSYATIVLCVLYAFLPETHAQKGGRISWTAARLQYVKMLQNRVFVFYLITVIAISSGEIAFALVLPFLVQVQLGLSPIMNGLLMLAAVSGFCVGALLSSLLSHYIRIHTILPVSLCIACVGAVVMWALAVMGYFSVPVLIFPMMVYTLGTGMYYPSCIAKLMGVFPKKAGTASGFSTAMQMLGAGSMTFIAAQLPIKNQVPLATLLCLLALSAMLCLRLAHKFEEIPGDL